MKLNDKNLKLLQIEAINFGIKRRRDEEIKSLINHLLDEGIYIDEFLEIIYSDDYFPIGNLTPFEKILKYFGIIVPESKKAMWYFLKISLEELTSGLANPLIILANIVENYSEHPSDEEGSHRIYIPHYTEVLDETEHEKFLGGNYGIHKLYGLLIENQNRGDEDYSTYFPKPRDESEICKDIIAEAKIWLEKYGDKYQLDDLLNI